MNASRHERQGGPAEKYGDHASPAVEGVQRCFGLPRLLEAGAPILAVILILAGAASLPVAFDEAYYWTWSRQLSFSYVDHPPGIAWILKLSTKIFGDGLFGLRIVSLGSMATIAWVASHAAQRFGDTPGRPKWTALGLLGAAPMFTLGYLPATPDPLQGATLALASYALLRALEGPERRGIWAGLATFLLVAGVLLKHSSILVLLGVLTAVAFNDYARRRLFCRQAFLGAVLGALGLVPWLHAEFAQGGGATAFQAARVFSASPRPWAALPLLLGAMVLTFGPSGAWGMLGLIRETLGSPARPDPVRCAGERVLAGGAILILTACLVAAALGSGEVNWAMPAFVFALPAIVRWADALQGSARAGFRWMAGLGGLFSVITLLHVVHPFLPYPPAKDRTLREAGFDSVALAAESEALRLGARVLVTRRYQPASMLRYHLRDRLLVHELGTGRFSHFDRLPRARACAGELVVVVSPGNELPPEVVADGAKAVRVERRRGARILDPWWIIPARLRANLPKSVGCPKTEEAP